MKTVSVNSSRHYNVHIGRGILSSIGEIVRRLTKATAVCIVSDSNVFPIYGAKVAESLANAGISFCNFIFPTGENSKNADTYLELLNFLSINHITRSDVLIALGGGVVGDLTGFAAATYLRGIPYIQVPTSLLAMVDSSVGGKTGIDLPIGKNLCGAFWQPTAVICDIDTLNTLSDAAFRDGCAEVIKYSILFDRHLFTHLEEKGLSFDKEAVISRCVELKREVVATDEFDKGQRMLLNLGHTIGHAVEACSGYDISHGKAVAIGMAMIARASKCQDCNQIIALLQKFNLPITTDFSAEALYQAALSDKKRSGDTINLVITHAIGDCEIARTPVEALQALIKEGI